MFKTVIIIAAAITAIGWIAYGVWDFIERRKEKSGPKPTPEHLKKVKSSFDDYIKKMEKFEKTPYKKQ